MLKIDCDGKVELTDVLDILFSSHAVCAIIGGLAGDRWISVVLGGSNESGPRSVDRF